MWTGKDIYLDPICFAEDITLRVTTTEATIISSTVTSYTSDQSNTPTLTLTETQLATPQEIRWVEVTLRPDPIHITYTSRITFTSFVVRQDSPQTTITHTSVASAVFSAVFTRRDTEDLTVTITTVVTHTTTVKVTLPPTTVTLTSTVSWTSPRIRNRDEWAVPGPQTVMVRVLQGNERTLVPNRSLPATMTLTTCGNSNSSSV